MNKALTLFSAILLLQGGDLIAKTRQLPIPKGSFSEAGAEFVARKMQMLESMGYAKAGASKTTATERVATIADYDLSGTPTKLDSITLAYSQGRGSAFDYQNVYYDIDNSHDYVNPDLFGTAYVNYDVAREVLSGNGIIGKRTYNNANKIVKYENDTAISIFQYNASNLANKIYSLQYNAATSNWDTVQRETLVYNAGGYLTQDDLESWDAGNGWQPSARLVFARDAAGRPQTADIQLPLVAGTYATAIKYNYTYPGTLPYPSVVYVQEGFSDFPNLTDYAKDTLGYTANTIVYRNSFQYDGTGWDLYYQERRHLNGASLPDSIFYRTWDMGIPDDSGYYKVAYNSNNNPVTRMDYYQSGPAPYGLTRWTYEPVEAAGIPTVKAQQLEFYPNPASDKIQLKGVTQGNFQIFNATGQIVASGKLTNAAMIPVQTLTPGIYMIRVLDASGKALQANLVRQ